eukprot:GHVQ01033104.1.p1 GENE.GHVQ01033104.1~~GHVQ01033104.1.p1  ORF type:complete len:182 (+),score=19.06 GHVQ01033104.1:324-869(+)
MVCSKCGSTPCRCKNSSLLRQNTRSNSSRSDSDAGTLLTVASVGALVGAAAVGAFAWWAGEKQAEADRQRVESRLGSSRGEEARGSSRGRMSGETSNIGDVAAENRRLREALDRERERRDDKSPEHASSSTVVHCCICLSSPVDVAFTPCGHAKTCEMCSATLTECPFCRAHIEKRNRIYI